MPPRRRTPANAKDAPVTEIEVDDPIPVEEPCKPAPTGTPWVPIVRRQHLELEVGVTKGAGGLVVGCATITCHSPQAEAGDVRLVMLHAHELLIDRVTIDDAPARVVRRGKVVVGDDGNDVRLNGDRQQIDPAAAKREAESADPIECATAALDSARKHTEVTDSGECDELVIARKDAGTVASGAPNDAESKTEKDVVIKVWYAAGPGAGDALPDFWRGTGTDDSANIGLNKGDHEFGWSVPGAGAVSTLVDDDDETEKFLVAPGAAARPAGWFPCVDDGSSLVHFSLGITVDEDLVVVAPGVLSSMDEDEEEQERTDTTTTGATEADSQNDVSNNKLSTGTKRFVFTSGGIPTQAHQVTLVVGKFATKRIANSVGNTHTTAFTAAAVAEEREKDLERQKEKRKENTDASNNPSSTNRSSTHSLFVPKKYSMELDLASNTVASSLTAFEEYLGRQFPYPGGVRFIFVPSDAMPTSGSNAVGSSSGVHGVSASAILGAGVVILPIDALAHPKSATDIVHSKNVIAECSARLLFGGFLEPASANDLWLAEGLASHLAGRCVIARTLGGDELRYRRAREAEAVIAADDGVQLPPLASQQSRVWMGGRLGNSSDDDGADGNNLSVAQVDGRYPRFWNREATKIPAFQAFSTRN